MNTCWCGGAVTWKFESNDSYTKVYVCKESEFHDPGKTSGLNPSQCKKLYIAGPMSNLPENNYPVFNKVAAALRLVGYDVVNPAEFGAPGGERVGYMDLLREDLKRMLDCDAVALLPRWQTSSGASFERRTAAKLGMPAEDWQTWLLVDREEVASQDDPS